MRRWRPSFQHPARTVRIGAVVSAACPTPPPGLWSAEMQFFFGDCLLDLERRELTLGAKAIAVGPQVFDLLAYLVQNRERVVSKDALLNAVWAGRIVSESTLASHINAVRRAIGDSGEEQHLIRTVPRKGFRFVGEVREAQPSDGPRSLTPKPDTGAGMPAPALPLPDRPSIAVL